MPLLIETSAGELIDKITILEIKLQNIRDPSKLANIAHEHELLTATLQQEIPRSAALTTLTAALKSVNAELWQIEDAIREQERAQSFGAEFVALARSVYRTNDRRPSMEILIFAA